MFKKQRAHKNIRFEKERNDFSVKLDCLYSNNSLSKC